EVQAVAAFAEAVRVDLVVAGDGHHLRAEALPRVGQRHAMLLIGVAIGAGRLTDPHRVFGDADTQRQVEATAAHDELVLAAEREDCTCPYRSACIGKVEKDSSSPGRSTFRCRYEPPSRSHSGKSMRPHKNPVGASAGSSTGSGGGAGFSASASAGASVSSSNESKESKEAESALTPAIPWAVAPPYRMRSKRSPRTRPCGVKSSPPAGPVPPVRQPP